MTQATTKAPQGSAAPLSEQSHCRIRLTDADSVDHKRIAPIKYSKIQKELDVVICRPPVRKFIRNTQNKTFLAKDGTWTTDLNFALEFSADDEARKTRDAYNLKECELYYCVGETPSSYDFVLPLVRLR